MTKLTAQAAGTFAIAPTPFHDDGRIDEKSIDRLADFYAEVGCDGVTVLGILGEAPKLDAAVYGVECRGYRDPRQGHLLLRGRYQEVGAAIQVKRHSGMVRQHQTRNLEIPGSMLCIAPE